MPSRDELPDPPDPQVWEHAPVLVPRVVALMPDLISDGGGLAFAPAALTAEFEPLDPEDPPVLALLEQIDRSRQRAQPERIFRRRQPPPATPVETRLAGWRLLAAGDDELLYGRGRPPRLVTAAIDRDAKGRWSCLGASAARQLRVAHDGMRASSWRLDPSIALADEVTELPVLLTELSRSSGVPTEDRLETPELFADPERLVLRLYVRPFEGFARPTPPREVPVIVKLPEPLAGRQVIDGAVYWTPPAAPADNA